MHVDLVENDWRHARQVLLARVTANGDEDVKVESWSPEWEDRLTRAIADPETGRYVQPASGSREYLQAVSRKYADGAYLFASDVHEDAACTWHAVGDQRDMATDPANRVQPQRRGRRKL